MSDSLWPHGLQHARLPCPSLSPKVCSNSCPRSRWCHPTISSSVAPFFSCPQSFPSPGSFPVSQFFTSGGQNIEVSASVSILPMNIQDWFPLGLTGLISLQSKGLSGILSNATVQKHQFFSSQPSLWSNSHIHTWLLEKPYLWLYGPFVSKVMSLLLNTLSRFVSCSSKKQASFNFMPAVTVCSDFGAQENKICHCFHFPSIYLPWSDVTRCPDLSFLNVEF